MRLLPWSVRTSGGFGSLATHSARPSGCICSISAPITHANREVEVQAIGNRERVTVFHACGIVHFIPKRTAGLSAHVAFAAPFKVVGEQLTVNTQMMSRQRLFIGFLAEPFADGDVTTVGSPITVLVIRVPPAVHPVSGDRPILPK